MVGLPHQRPCPGHSQSHGHRAGGVARHKGVGIALLRLWKARHAAEPAQALKIRLAAGQQLMHIRLMTHVKYQAVNGGIKYRLQSHRQLHHA